MTIANHPNTLIDTRPLLLDVSNTTLTITPEQFSRLCIDNPNLRLELTPNKELIVMAPAFSISSEKNGDLSGQVWYWNRQTDLGRAFDSSAGYDFTALDGGILSPDTSWVEKSRIEGVSIEQFCPIVPDFVIELRSTTDGLKPLQEKMKEYQRLGVKLGLLVDPKNKRVEIYRPGQETEVLESPASIASLAPLEIDCNEVMPGFVLNMNKIW
jgi:Uma2 family endonuclease